MFTKERPSSLTKGLVPRKSKIINRCAASVAPRFARRPYQPRSLPAGPLLCLILTLCAIFFASSAAAQGRVEVEWREGRLSVTAKDSPLSQILQQVARLTGTEFKGLDKALSKVSVSFAGAQLAEGLQNLLTPLNYVIIGDVSGPETAQQARVMIFGQQPIPHRNVIGVSSQTKPPIEPTPELTPQESVITEELEAPEQESAETEAQADPEKKLAALYASLQHGDKEALREAMQDSNPTIQASAFEALAAQDREEAIDALLAAVKSDQSATRLQALQLLNQVAQAEERTVLSTLRDALKDGDPTERAYAVQALAGRGGTEAMGYLGEAARDPDPSVRGMVISSVADKDEGFPLLEEALSDPDESVSSTAALLLKQTGRKER